MPIVDTSFHFMVSIPRSGMVATWSGNQDKSRKTKKNVKSQENSGKNGGF